MLTQAPKRTTLIYSCGFAVLCIVLMILAFGSFGGTTPLAPAGYRFSIVVGDAQNLVTGSDVQEAGVKIGRVTRVSRIGNRGLIMIELAPKYAPIRSGATAIVRTKSLLGEAYVEIAPGPPTAPTLRDGDRLAPSQVKTSVSFNDFLDSFGPQPRAHLRQLFAGLAQAFAGRSSALSASLGLAAPISSNLNTVLGMLSSQRGSLQQLFNDSGTVLGALGERQRDLRAAITAGDNVLTAVAQRNRALQSTMRDLTPFLDELRQTSGTITAAARPLNRAAHTLFAVSPLIPSALREIDQNVPKFDALFRALPQTAAAARRGLPPLTRISSAIPSGFNQLYPTLRQLIPVVQVFNAYKEQALITPFVNGGSAFAGTFVGPGGKITHRANAVLYVSNETVVGWTKRLPTNRANPYPTPDAYKELHDQGFYDSYDCRNIHNPIGLPAIGTGVPPCLQQGPWNYQGHTAYYPRLQQAGP